MFGKVSPLLRKIVIKKPILLNEYAKMHRMKNFDAKIILKAKLDLIDELLEGKG